MTLASSSKTQLVIIEEAAFGVTPATSTSKYLRMTGESLAYDIQTAASEEINASRQVTDMVHVGATAQGGVNLELSYREYDPLLEALLSGTFTTFGTGGVKALTCSFNHTLGTITDDGIDGFIGLVAGQWFSVIGGANAGVYRIGSRTNDAITVDTDTPLVSTVPAVSCSITGTRLSLGTAALRSFTIEKRFTDVSQFFAYRGMSPSKLDLSFDTGSILKGSISFMGANSTRASVTFITGTPADSQPFGVDNAVTGVGAILLDGALIANTYVKSAKISVDGKLRGQTAIGSLGNVGLGAGTFEIGGTLELYLVDGAIYDQAIANSLLSLEIPVMDVDNNGYTFIFNNIKLGVPTVAAGSKDNDVMLSVPFTAVAPTPTTDKMLIIDRFGVIAA